MNYWYVHFVSALLGIVSSVTIMKYEANLKVTIKNLIMGFPFL